MHLYVRVFLLLERLHVFWLRRGIDSFNCQGLLDTVVTPDQSLTN